MLSRKISHFVLPFMAMVSLHANDPFFNDPFGDDIFKEMYQMQKEMDKVFERMQQRMDQRSQRLYSPTRQSLMTNKGMRKMSLLEDKGSYYEYNTQIPENKNNQLDITIEEGVLHIKARVATVTQTNQSNIKMEQHTMRMFQSSETLPADVDVSTLKGEYKQGVFVLTLQKKGQTKNSLVKKEATTQLPKKEKVHEKKQVDIKVEVQAKEKKETNSTRIKIPETSSNA